MKSHRLKNLQKNLSLLLFVVMVCPWLYALNYLTVLLGPHAILQAMQYTFSCVSVMWGCRCQFSRRNANLSALYNVFEQIQVAARSKVWVCDRSLAVIVVSHPPRGRGLLPVVSVVCCQVEVSAKGRSLVQRSPTECVVSECDCEASRMRRPWPTGGCCAMVNSKFQCSCVS